MVDHFIGEITKIEYPNDSEDALLVFVDAIHVFPVSPTYLCLFVCPSACLPVCLSVSVDLPLQPRQNNFSFIDRIELVPLRIILHSR